MDVFALLFILSFIALIVTLVVMSVRKRITFSRLTNKLVINSAQNISRFKETKNEF